jgi:hypothetical protein
MIPEAMFLFLLIGDGKTAYEEKYIGKIPSCNQAQQILNKVKNKYSNVNGYICVDAKSFDARRKFQKTPTPSEKKVIEDVKELLPQPKAKPLIPLKRKE